MPIHFNLLKTLAGHSYDVNSVAFSRDSKLLASGGGDRTVRVWGVATHALLHVAEHGEWVNSVCFAPSGQAVASGARDGSVKLWNTENASLFGTIQAHAQNVSSVAFSPDGRRLASGGGDGHVRVFNLREKRIERDIAAHTGWVWSVVFSTTGDRLVSAGADKTARVWTLETSDSVALEGHGDDVLAAAFSPDDRFVATSCKDGYLRLYEADTGKPLYEVEAHEGAVNAVAFSTDGLHVATAGADHTIRVWQVEDAALARELTGHQDYVASVVFARDGRAMASCGGDGTVKIWEVTERSAYSSGAERDPMLEIEHEDAGPRPERYASAYAAGKTVAEATLKNGIKIVLQQAGRDKYALAVGEGQRVAATIGSDQVGVLNSNGLVVFKLDVASRAVAYDRTEGAAAPWEEEKERAAEARTDPGLELEVERGAAAYARPAEMEIERAGGESSRYQSFDRLGQALARERFSTGHALRVVRFDADTIYVLFDQDEHPTLVLRNENLDVRDGTGKAVFRMNLRSLEPVVSRTAQAEAAPVEEAPPDPLLVRGLSEIDVQQNQPRIHRLLSNAVWSKASDVHVPSGTRVLVRRNGRLQPFEERSYTPAEIESMIFEILTPHQRAAFEKTGDLDFSYEVPKVGRFRANVLRQHRGIDATFRIIPESIPTIESLGLPAAVPPLTKFHNGLVLITGPAGQGKSTTIAALVDMINSEKPHHIITVEDPIEFVHPIKRAVVNQREVGRHTKSFANALRAALREDPDVIIVGEMRDLETISLAITASETGHLVFGSLMTSSAAQTIDRILDSFPAGQQSQIRTMMSESLRGIVSQQLVPTVGGDSRVLACEVLLGTPAVANLVRERKTFQIPSVMQTSRTLGMQRMDDALFDHFQAGRITAESALMYAQDPKALEARVRPRPTAPPEGAATGMRRP